MIWPLGEVSASLYTLKYSGFKADDLAVSEASASLDSRVEMI